MSKQRPTRSLIDFCPKGEFLELTHGQGQKVAIRIDQIQCYFSCNPERPQLGTTINFSNSLLRVTETYREIAERLYWYDNAVDDYLVDEGIPDWAEPTRDWRMDDFDGEGKDGDHV